MRIGVYIDGYNLYYGARSLCGRGTAGWRWLDVRALARELTKRAPVAWQGASLERIVYCTARVDAATNPDAHRDQDVYLKALVGHRSVDWIEYGNYVARAKKGLLVDVDPHTHRPVIHAAQWPVMVQDSNGVPVRDARFMVQYLHLEEKGSDVNVATHLLLDALTQSIDAAIIISNDSDLALPISKVRNLIPVMLVNPQRSYLAGALRGSPTDGVGGHVWLRLTDAEIRGCQLPNPAGGQTCPVGW